MRRKNRSLFAPLLLASAAIAIGAAPFAGAMCPDSFAMARTEESDDQASRASELYDRGTKALDEGDWARAIAAFQEVVKLGESRSDGALYWVAYSVAKQGRKEEALAILRGFDAKCPKSEWRKDVRALELEIRPSSGRSVIREGGDDEDLKLMAINGLMSSEPEQAVPMLEKVIGGNASPRVKERALFVLAQSASPRARQVIADIARGGSRPELQEKAIQYLGVSGGKENGQLLADIYKGTASAEIKEKILHAFMISGDKVRVLEAARNEKTPELRSAAVHLLGVMGAQSELRQMYRAESSESVKETILQALFVSGDVDHVLELARTETNPRLRREAIHKLGLMGGGSASAALLSIYRADTDPEVKKAAIQGLFLQNDAKPLIEIARSEKDPRLKAEAVSKLSIMQNKDATDYMIEILNH